MHFSIRPEALSRKGFKALGRIGFMKRAPFRSWIALKRVPQFFNQHLIGRGLRMVPNSSPKLRGCDGIFASLVPHGTSLGCTHFFEDLVFRSMNVLGLNFRRILFVWIAQNINFKAFVRIGFRIGNFSDPRRCGFLNGFLDTYSGP